MAYYTGSAASLTALYTALTTQLLANGFSNSGNIYWKGTLYVSLVQTSNRIEVRGGTGQSAGVLTGGPVAEPIYGQDGTVSMGAIGSTGLQFPATYHLHIETSPDEVYLFVNESSTRWSWLAFGQSPAPGISATGNWFGASVPGKSNNRAATLGGPSLLISTTPGGTDSMGFFMEVSYSGSQGNSTQPYNCSIHHGLDGNTWSKAGSEVGAEGQSGWAASPSCARTMIPLYPLWSAQPNAWNQQAILMKPEIYVKRSGGKHSKVGSIAHSRYARNTNYNDGDIITIGSDQWKIYPMVKKNTTTPDGGTQIEHSGTIALAVRYNP